MHSKMYKLWEENRNKNFGLLNINEISWVVNKNILFD